MNVFLIGESHLTIEDVVQIANKKLKIDFSDDTIEKIKNCQAVVEGLANGEEPVYGINTGFGPLCTTKISPEYTKKLQENLLRSHSVGVGEPLRNEIVLFMLITKLHALSKGYSGVKFETLLRIKYYIENDIIPYVPSQGSVGASGDLAPLAHLFLPLIGQGMVRYKNSEWMLSIKVQEKLNLEPIVLGAKEGLALINGTQYILAHAVDNIYKMENLMNCADLIGAMSLEALLGSAKPFDNELHELRPFPAQKFVANKIYSYLFDSELVASHENCERVQDPYSLRCIPQVHGTSRTAWLHVKQLVDIELNSVTDNPIIFNNEKTISGGNFHGQPLALPMDYLGLAAAELGNISDRRTYLLLEGKVGLPTLLMKNTGINSGFMIPQYTSAALVSENKSLCFPASADSIPTSLGQEDHVSMGSISARKTQKILENLTNILAVEAVCAAQAFDFRKPLKSSEILEKCHELIRNSISHATEDRIFADDILKMNDLIQSRSFNDIIHAWNINHKNEIWGVEMFDLKN